MTLSLPTISKIQNMTFHGLSQRAIAAMIGHTLASVNKYSKLLRYYTHRMSFTSATTTAAAYLRKMLI